MKKLMIFVGALTLTGSLFAQKPSSDDAKYSLEGLANLNTTDGMSWTAPNLRLRYFVNDNIAARVQFGFGGDGTSVASTPSSESYTYYENPDGSGATGTVDISRSQWNLSLGAEYHLSGTDRMSPYFTAGFNVGNDTRTEISSFGLNLGAGIDYYVAENIYVGLELGFNYNSADGTKTSGFAGGSAVRMGWRF